MALVRKISGGWQGVVTGRHYYAPRECQESAEAQERPALQARPFNLPKDCKPGSAEEARLKVQEEALENIDRVLLTETILGYRTFCAHHPEYLPNNQQNSEELLEWFHMKGFRFVMFNDAWVPLSATADKWEEAYQWKLAMNKIQVDPTVMNAQQRLQAQKEAGEFFKNEAPTEADLEAMVDTEITRRTGAWR